MQQDGVARAASSAAASAAASVQAELSEDCRGVVSVAYSCSALTGILFSSCSG